MMTMVPVVIGLLTLVNKEMCSISDILKVPINTNTAPKINIAGAKYGIDMYTDCSLEISVINWEKAYNNSKDCSYKFLFCNLKWI